MVLRNEWEVPQARSGGVFNGLGMGAVRVALLFGSAAVGLALILTPVMESQVERMAYSYHSSRIDPMATGAITRGINTPVFGDQRASSTYTVRRSVLQPSPSSVCIIRNNGMRTGDC